MDDLNSYIDSVNQAEAEESRHQRPSSGIQTASSDIFSSSRGSSRGPPNYGSRPGSHGPAQTLNDLSDYPPAGQSASNFFEKPNAGRALSAGSGGIIRAKLPPLGGEFQSHQRLIPRTQAGSTYIKRHNISHGIPLGTGLLYSNQAGSTGSGTGSRSTSPKSGAVRLTALGSGHEGAMSARHRGQQQEEQQRSHWSCSSVGDLEALDSILDQLVVLDHNMREALMNGPLISFETVVPEPRAADMYGTGEDVKDNTFLTSVKETMGVGASGQGTEGAQEDANDTPLHAAAHLTHPPWTPSPHSPRMGDPLVGTSPHGHTQERGGGYHGNGAPIHEHQEVEALRASMPVPILPKLARMYITNKQTQQLKAPPAMPPTAEYLLRSRPGQSIAAPSYNALCQQIRDVQRQYTCGTTKEHVNDPNAPPGSNADMYISGLDGPLLKDVILHEDLPIGLEHSRPSFVAMRRAIASGRKAKWSTSTYR